MGLEMHWHRIDGYGSALELGRDGLKIPKAGLLPAPCRPAAPALSTFWGRFSSRSLCSNRCDFCSCGSAPWVRSARSAKKGVQYLNPTVRVPGPFGSLCSKGKSNLNPMG